MARNVILLDTGPLVAALARDDRAHAWAKEQFETLAGPFLTCEAVITEACHLLRAAERESTAVSRLLESGALRLGMDLRRRLLRFASCSNATGAFPRRSRAHAWCECPNSTTLALS